MRIGLAGAGRIGSYHAAALLRLPQTEALLITDADPSRSLEVAGRLGATAVGSAGELLDSGIDALVVATATAAHPSFILRGVAAGIPVFCEKPVAADVAGTLDVIKQTSGSAVPVHVGFQRRFDAGYAAARAAVQSGSLGWVHTIRATTLDAAPPPPAYLPLSGGFFRDCAVHDFDAIRWVSGCEVTEAYALGMNRGEPFFREAGDVDTLAVLLTLDDGTLATVSGSRYNAAGYDVRLEVLGSAGCISTGLDDGLPMRSAEPGATFPAGPAYPDFTARFAAAYRAELADFVALAADGGRSPCTMLDALEALYIAEACELSRSRHEPVAVAEVRQ